MSVAKNLAFKEFFLEMQTTLDEKNRLRTIISKLIENDKDWLDKQRIFVGNKANYWVLNYAQGARNEFNGLVRGLVVLKPQGPIADPLQLIRSFPFTRFFNQGEKEVAPVNMQNAEMLEKMDGTMVGVFFPHGDPSKPEFHTRKLVSSHPEDFKKILTTFTGVKVPFLPKIKQFVDTLIFTQQDVNYTYVFEFIHEVSKVVSKYAPEQYGLYLLGARNLETHRELSEDELDKTALRLRAKRPRRFDAVADKEDIEKMFDVAAANVPDFEGFIFRDKTTGHRMKVKDPRYVEKHHKLDNSYTTLVIQILKDEDSEVAAYFPHIKKRIVKIKQAMQDFLQKTLETVQDWRAKNLDQKALTHALFGTNPLAKWELRLKKMRGERRDSFDAPVKNKFVQNMILKYSKMTNDNALANAIEKEFKLIGLGQGTNLGDPKHILELIGVDKEEADEGSDDVGEL